MFICTKRALVVWVSVLAACLGGRTVDYTSADPVNDARTAVLKKHEWHLLSIRVGDSVVTPVDSAYEHTEVNVATREPIRYVSVVADPEAPGVPGRAQLSYVKRYNTEMFRILEENARPPRRP